MRYKDGVLGLRRALGVSASLRDIPGHQDTIIILSANCTLVSARVLILQIL